MNLKSYLIESLKGSSLNTDEYVVESHSDQEDEILDFINENYQISGKLTINDDNIVDCEKDVQLKHDTDLKYLTNNLFRWGKVNNFSCDNCPSIISLEGAPKECKRFFCTVL